MRGRFLLLGFLCCGLGGALGLAGVACDANVNSGTGPSGVPPQTALADLTPAQVHTLCDWVNFKVGGYGAMAACEAGPLPAVGSDQDLATCMDRLTGPSACTNLTAGQIIDCANALNGDLCQLSTAAACAPMLNCSSPAGTPDGSAPDGSGTPDGATD
jgi:hypothetical protein